MEYQAKKGDIIAVERKHSSTYVHGETVRHSTWHIGRATSVRRDGMVKSAVLADRRTFGDYERQHNMVRFLVISDAALRAAAETIMGQEFTSGEELKNAIRSAA